MKCLLRQAHIRFNNFIFGMADSGAMTTELVLGFLRNLPKGVTELYFHPATARCPEIDYTMQNYRHEEEFQTLTSESLLQAFRSAGIQRISFSDL